MLLTALGVVLVPWLPHTFPTIRSVNFFRADAVFERSTEVGGGDTIRPELHLTVRIVGTTC